MPKVWALGVAARWLWPQPGHHRRLKPASTSSAQVSAAGAERADWEDEGRKPQRGHRRGLKPATASLAQVSAAQVEDGPAWHQHRGHGALQRREIAALARHGPTNSTSLIGLPWASSTLARTGPRSDKTAISLTPAFRRKSAYTYVRTRCDRLGGP